MNDWQYPGAKWWKFDFHTHTPASTADFLKGCSEEEKAKVTPEYWLQQFMKKRIDCVAITDHNSGAWVDRLKDELERMRIETEKPDWYRPLSLFPGVEISANGGIHILALFGADTTTGYIDSLLGAVEYKGTRGGSDSETEKSAVKVIEIIHQCGGVAIPAHVDKGKGLFQLLGTTLEGILDSPYLNAIELCDENPEKPQLYIDKKLQWTEVRGSDTHNFRIGRFGTFTWVKMDTPSIEGLRLALIDGSASINRDMTANPNQHADFVIEQLAVTKAKYMGRDPTLTCAFSPFLNGIIGGRGSGKSTLLEFMRFALRREKDIPEPLVQESKKYFTVDVDNDGLLLKESILSLIYRKGATRYRLNWSANADIASLEVWKENGWEAEAGDIKSLFPVYIYSQKQILALAQQPDVLLSIIDRDTSVNFTALDKERVGLVNRYKQLGQQARELREKIGQENTLSGSLNDLSRQIERIEQSGHKGVLQNYRQRQRQLTAIKQLETRWQAMTSRLQEMQEAVAPVPFDAQTFDAHQDILRAITNTNKEWHKIEEELSRLTEEGKAIVEKWQQGKASAPWMQFLNIDIETYAQLRTQLAQQGIDLGKYPQLLQRQAQDKKELQQIHGYAESLTKLDKEQQEILTKLEENRQQLTANRRLFLTSVLKDNQSVDINVKPFGQPWEGCEADIRQLLQCLDRFDKDFEELKTLYQEQDENKERAIQHIKTRVVKIRDATEPPKDVRFATHLKSLPQESISDLRCWFPQDALDITFDKKQNIQQGSPGQKTAALLAFILAYGTEPLLLDQPEDDLDNALIYALIVKQLRETKSRRQIIVVTHNANIVVNGDAEMVLPLTVKGGKSCIKNPASIQNNAIREEICTILEGGQQAFEQRYKRIHLES